MDLMFVHFSCFDAENNEDQTSVHDNTKALNNLD